MKKTLPQVKRAALTGSTAALAILSSLALTFTTLAKGKPGGGGEDPPAEPPPFLYQVSWIAPQNASDTITLRDVAPDGTVVGSFLPGGAYGTNIALIEFPDGTEINLEDMLHTAGQVPATWRVTYAYRICDGLLIAVDVYDETDRLYCGALQLKPDRSLDTFTLFDVPNGDDAFLMDASESGDFLIATGDFSAHSQGSLSINNPAIVHVWTPSSGATITLPDPIAGGQGGWFFNSKLISDYPAAIIEDSFFEYTTSQTTSLPGSETAVTTLDLGADGTVVAHIEGPQLRRNKKGPSALARWNPGAEQWETLLTGGSTAFVGSTGEIAMGSSGDLFVFHDDYGLQSVNDMIDPAQAGSWNGSDSFTLRGLSNPLPGDPFGGVILGEDTTTGGYFVLTPVAAP